MADARATVLPWPLDPDRVARASFSHSFRGFDPGEVRSFLARLAGELAALRAREAELTARISELEHRRPVTAGHLDSQQVTELLGAEAARVLDAAREAAAAIRANAERHAGEALEEARAEAEDLRSRAEAFMGERTAAGEAEAARIIEAAELEGERLAQEARAVEEQARRDAAARLDAAREDGRRMVAEAKAVRERVLSDMARRRNHARQQLEKLRAGRERLLEAVEAVRRAAEEVGGELNGSLVEARLAGERAARQVDVEAIPVPNELDAEVELAKDAGLIDLAAIEREVQAGAGVDDDAGDRELGGVAGPGGTEALEHQLAAVGAGPFDIELDDADGEGVGGDAPDEPEDRDDKGAGSDERVGAGSDEGARADLAASNPVEAGTSTSAVDEASAGQHSAPDGSGALPGDAADGDAADGDAAGGDAAGGDPQPASHDQLTEDGGISGEQPASPTADATTGEAGAEPDGTATTTGRRKAPGTRPGGTRGAKATPARPTAAGPRRPRSAAARPAGFGDAVDDVFSRIKHTPAPEGSGRPAPAAATSAASEATERGAGAAADPPTTRPDGGATGSGAAPARPTAARPTAARASADVATADAEGDADPTTGRRPPAPDRSAPDRSVPDRSAPDRAAVHARDAVLAGTSRDLVRQLKLALSDEQNLVLELCRDAGGAQLPAERLPSGAAAAGPYRTVARRELATARAAGWRAGLGEPSGEGGAGRDDGPPADDGDLEAVADELVAALTDPVRQRLADLAAGDSDQPADQVRNLYRETRNDRVGGLAEHAALAAYAAGQLAALRHVAAAGGRSDTADGPVAVRWVFDACSPDCLDNSLVAGVPVGQPFPTGHLRPPAFPGCRCLLAPAAGDPSPRGRVATPAV